MTPQEFERLIEETYSIAVKKTETINCLKGSGKVFQFEADDVGFAWHMDAFAEPVYRRGEAGKFTVKATMSSANWIKFMAGELSPVNATLTKKMKIEGASVALTQLPLAVLRKAYQEAMGPGTSGPAKGNER